MPDSVYHSFKDAAERAAAQSAKKRCPEEVGRLREATFHTLRHSFASWLIQSGVPIAEVQQYLGQGLDTMTGRYAHLVPAAKERRNALWAPFPPNLA
jgi:integrase